MSDKATSTTPDPELFMAPDRTKLVPNPAEKVLSGEGVRGEVAGCPTGMAGQPQAQQPQQPGGAGAPGTGVTEKQMQKFGDKH